VFAEIHYGKQATIKRQ